ncbi:hypothetical protein DIC66_13400 [Rhodoferax lacus]|uniref:VCBS repeat-containing protein n=1 Tax=Rhodoferax lacus TaxID=2184758 RepID=A0A3E1RAK8_9BURK|nr:VCBS repeat-containing protein [Rhodoferax lacus]RFO96303.1 hypothetical protein DIC66_13400 [Rhodoferax lacus]
MLFQPRLPELQALANAAARLIAAAGGTPSEIAALTIDDLKLLGVKGVTVDNLPAVIAAIGKTTPDTAVDTVDEIQTVATTAQTAAANALAKISNLAGTDKADANTPSLDDYTAAGVTGGFVINGSSNTKLNVLSASNAGDVNGDGLQDLIIGSSDGTTGGSTYVVFGKTDNTAISIDDITNGTGGFKITGPVSAGVTLGVSVSSAGDLNGDGLSDLIVGTATSTNAARPAGAAYVIYGKAPAQTMWSWVPALWTRA